MKGNGLADDLTMKPADALAPVIALARHVGDGLVGHEHLVERLMTALLASGHVLIEGPPGLAKTRAVKRLAAGLSGSFARIQCTPDLMPSDMIGTQIFRPDSGDFDFRPGPIFHELVLVDEINRAPPKVQSALLEAMAEGQVTTGGATRALPDPFMIVATQNSIEHEGTFPLPEAQLDRFMMHLDLALPGIAAERAILDMVEAEILAGSRPDGAHAARPDGAVALLGAPAIRAARQAVSAIHLSPALRDFIVRLVVATREVAGGPLDGFVEHAVSPRGTLALAAGARARAALSGRDHALPDDVQALAPDILSHRLIPSWRATSDGLDSRDLIGRLLGHVQPW